MRAQKESLKNRLARALEMQRAGLPITDKQAEELLFREMEVGTMPPVPVPPTPAVVPPPTTEGKAEGDKGKAKSEEEEAEAAQKRRESRRNTKARRRQRKAQEAAAKGGQRRRVESSSDDDEDSSDDEEEGKGKAGEGPVEMDVSGPEEKATAISKGKREAEEDEDGEEEEQEDADMEAGEEEEEDEEGGEGDSEGDEDEDEDDDEDDEDGEEGSEEEEEGDEEEEEEGMDEAAEGKKAAPSVAKGAAGGGFGAMMMAQLAKLKVQKPVPPASAPGTKPFSLSGRCTVPGLETLDWATILDALCSSDGPDGEAAFKGPKYVPRQLELLTPGMARLKGKLKDEDQGERKREAPQRHVRVQRREEIQAVRMQLPVCGMEQEIVEAVLENHVIVLCGETGSGKSTQVPQFLYEFGYARSATAPLM
jgi:ATP-dependent RNA helicase DHX37/DHR1